MAEATRRRDFEDQIRDDEVAALARVVSDVAGLPDLPDISQPALSEATLMPPLDLLGTADQLFKGGKAASEEEHLIDFKATPRPPSSIQKLPPRPTDGDTLQELMEQIGALKEQVGQLKAQTAEPAEPLDVMALKRIVQSAMRSQPVTAAAQSAINEDTIKNIVSSAVSHQLGHHVKSVVLDVEAMLEAHLNAITQDQNLPVAIAENAVPTAQPTPKLPIKKGRLRIGIGMAFVIALCAFIIGVSIAQMGLT